MRFRSGCALHVAVRVFWIAVFAKCCAAHRYLL